MANHKLFIAWAFNRHCSAPHNADFEVCQDKACVRARGYENAQQNAHLTLLESAPLEALSTPEHLATSQSDSAPTTAQVA